MRPRSALPVLLACLSLTTPAASHGDEDLLTGTTPAAEAPRSALIGPLHLGDEPPELRTLAAIWLRDGSGEGDSEEVRVATRELAADLARQLRGGADWYQISRLYSSSRNRSSGSVLGTVARGMLLEAFDQFLWSAEVGEISDPVTTEAGVFVLRRMETSAGCRMIVIRGSDERARARADEVMRLLGEGAEFAELAREYSTHVGSAGRGGQWSVYERGIRDSHIKLEVFRAEVGEVVGPIEGGTSLFIAKRVAPDEIDRSLRENNWVRLRGLMLSFDNAPLVLRPNPRDVDEALVLIEELRGRIEAGEDMAELAREYDDDSGGRERGGDLGWVHRNRPSLPGALRFLWNEPQGTLTRVMDLKVGFAIFRREG